MKKLLVVLLALAMVFAFAACGDTTEDPAQNPVDDQQGEVEGEGDEETPVTGKIAIVTNTVSQNEEEYRSAESMVEKYGDQVIHELLPDNFMTEQEQLISVISKCASNEEVKVLVLNQAVPGVNAAVDKVLETRDREDLLIIYCTPQENPPDVAARADIILQPNELAMGYSMVEQAYKMGAKVFVHYSFPRHMSQVLLGGRRDIMRSECERLGIEFVDATAPDPTGDSGTTGAQMFILEDVPKMVETYGTETAFFSTNCSMQVPLIKACFDAGAIYPQPCCPSPYHGYPAALGIETPEDMVAGIDEIIEATEKVIVDAGLAGRFSTWPVPAAMMCTVAATEYGMKWMAGETDGRLDLDVLSACMKDYAGMEIELENYTDENGTTYDNYLLFLIDYYTYGGLPADGPTDYTPSPDRQ